MLAFFSNSPTASAGRRHLLVLLAVFVFSSSLAQAQSGGVRLMVGFPAGGGTDAIARIFADKLKDQLGTSVVVENKAGAGGQLAAQALKAAPADGSVLFLTHDHTVSILPLVVLPLSSMRWRCLAARLPSRSMTTWPGSKARATRAMWACPHRPRCRSFWSR